VAVLIVGYDIAPLTEYVLPAFVDGDILGIAKRQLQIFSKETEKWERLANQSRYSTQYSLQREEKNVIAAWEKIPDRQ